MTTCTVKTWMKTYGFAEAASGEVVYVHRTNLPEGMRLKVGGKITCTMVTIDGHSGRVKCEDVKGDAVVPISEKPTKEELKAEREDWSNFKKEKIAVEGADPPKKRTKNVEKKIPKTSISRGGRGMGGGGGGFNGRGGRGVARNQGRFAGAGPLPIISARTTTELRIDSSDGQAYPKSSFKQVYGGYAEWDRALPLGRGRGLATRGGRGRY
eukprot:TRINITY_DN37357_c0_g1_i1.p1 TRINITY_DN37357_c0_g1~~TRINITY_DN37357_c0_g1_i1.p1  ORF type:complete len:211 (+),score=37.18 TRINITY_DN37357_c0_g1_i1:36-668(+)